MTDNGLLNTIDKIGMFFLLLDSFVGPTNRQHIVVPKFCRKCLGRVNHNKASLRLACLKRDRVERNVGCLLSVWGKLQSCS
jgi:hypothetical protein